MDIRAGIEWKATVLIIACGVLLVFFSVPIYGKEEKILLCGRFCILFFLKVQGLICNLPCCW